MPSIRDAVILVVEIVIGAIIFGLLDYLVQSAPFVSATWKPIIHWIILALAILVLIGILLSFAAGTPVFRWS